MVYTVSHRPNFLLNTDQTACYDEAGTVISCANTGQDAAANQTEKNLSVQCFHVEKTVVRDRLTGLMWPRNANINEFPLTWEEARAYVRHMNRSPALGYTDWRLPHRYELYTLVSHAHFQPVLARPHPFRNYTGFIIIGNRHELRLEMMGDKEMIQPEDGIPGKECGFGIIFLMYRQMYIRRQTLSTLFQRYRNI